MVPTTGWTRCRRHSASGLNRVLDVHLRICDLAIYLLEANRPEAFLF